MIGFRRNIVLIILLIYNFISSNSLIAGNSSHNLNAVHKEITFYQLTEVQNYLNEVLLTNGNPRKEQNVVLDYYFAGDHQKALSVLLSQHTDMQSVNNLNVNALYSVILENLEKNTEAISFWKAGLTKHPNMESRASNEIFYQLSRIHNDLQQAAKALLFEQAFLFDTINNGEFQRFAQYKLETARTFLLLNDTARTQAVLNELGANNQAIRLDYPNLLKYFNLLLWTSDSGQLLQDAAHLVTTNYQNQAVYLQIIADQCLAAFNTTDKDIAIFHLQSSLTKNASFLSIINKVIGNKKTMNGAIRESGFKRYSLSQIIVVIVFSMIFLGLLLFFMISFRKFTKIIKEKLGQIATSQQEDGSSIQTAFSNLEALVNERESDLQKEIIERERVDAELNEALSNTAEANFQKNAFLSNISHEIRTPLNGIIGFSSLLENELALLEQPEMFEYANSIQKSGEKLLHLLNNIIDISRLEANDLEFKIESCEIKTIVDETIQHFIGAANEKGIRIVKEISAAFAMADKDMLQKVIYEMLDNAIKFTDKGYIKIIAEEQAETDQIRIIIKDTGIGIDDNYLPDLFEAYRHESHGYSRQYQGAALGIPLSKQLVEKMNGLFKIESQKAAGTSVFIQLPKAQQLMPIIAEKKECVLEDYSAKLKSLLKGGKVLLVEDDLASRKIIIRFLEPFAEIIALENGDDALHLIQSQSMEQKVFTLFIFDYNLPTPWDGVKLLRKIKSEFPIYKDIPAISQTAYAMYANKEEILSAGFDAFLSKPIQRRFLYEEIIQIFDKNFQK